VFISTALAGWSVGLAPGGRGQYAVYFGRLQLGQLDESTASFKRTPTAGAAQEKAA
jgi:hypothetical protein